MILIFRGGMPCELNRRLSNATDSDCAHDTQAHQVASLDEDKRRFTLSFV
jgi:hypothetical protein